MNDASATMLDLDQVSIKRENGLVIANLDPARHPAMKGTHQDYLTKSAEELLVDQELGLVNQANIDAQALLKQDIDVLTQSNSYHQVTKDIVSRIFTIPQLNRMCLGHNIVEAVARTATTLWASLLCAALTVLSGGIAVSLWIWAAHVDHVSHTVDAPFWITCLGVLFLVGFVAAIAGMIYLWGNKSVDYFFHVVRLVLEPISKTQVKIPYAAKLKILEAQGKNIFNDFVIAYPSFDIQKKSLHFPPLQLDPMILGVTQDQRYFLIVWWDLKKDIEHVLSDMKVLKNFKIEN